MNKTKSVKWAKALIGIMFIFAWASLASADSLYVDLSANAFVLNQDSSKATLLLKFNFPENLSDGNIAFAELKIPILSIIPDSSLLPISCYPFPNAWNAGEVAWYDLEDTLGQALVSEPGSDYATSAAGSQIAYFDVTEIVNRWAHGELANNGLILFCPSWTSSRFFAEGDPNNLPVTLKLTM